MNVNLSMRSRSVITHILTSLQCENETKYIPRPEFFFSFFLKLLGLGNLFLFIAASLHSD